VSREKQLVQAYGVDYTHTGVRINGLRNLPNTRCGIHSLSGVNGAMKDMTQHHGIAPDCKQIETRGDRK
jgi:hypothetical protein